MNPNPSIGDYFASPYLALVVIVLLLSIAWILSLRKVRRIKWPRETKWRSFMLITGWIVLLLAILFWSGLLYIAISGLRSDVENYYPKKPSFELSLLGMIIYFFLLGVANTAVKAAHGSARDDIMKLTGREKD